MDTIVTVRTPLHKVVWLDAHGPAAPVPRDMAGLDLKALAAKITATDRSAANGSSIAQLLEHRGASVLLAADAFATVMVPALQALARQRKQPGGLVLDAIKLSHHGSRANVTNELLKAVRADHYIVSTNGAIFCHPDDEAVARVLVHGGRHPHVAEQEPREVLVRLFTVDDAVDT